MGDTRSRKKIFVHGFFTTGNQSCVCVVHVHVLALLPSTDRILHTTDSISFRQLSPSKHGRSICHVQCSACDLHLISINTRRVSFFVSLKPPFLSFSLKTQWIIAMVRGSERVYKCIIVSGQVFFGRLRICTVSLRFFRTSCRGFLALWFYMFCR
jgi:hypothetical protein